MWGTPQRSRSTSTGASRPLTVTVPARGDNAVVASFCSAGEDCAAGERTMPLETMAARMGRSMGQSLTQATDFGQTPRLRDHGEHVEAYRWTGGYRPRSPQGGGPRARHRVLRG